LIYVEVLEVNSNIIKKSTESLFEDFEDAVQYFTALNSKMDVLLTRNITDYVLDDIPVMKPDEFLKSL